MPPHAVQGLSRLSQSTLASQLFNVCICRRSFQILEAICQPEQASHQAVWRGISDNLSLFVQVAHFEGQTHSNSTCFHISRPDSYSLLSCSLSSKNTTKKLVLTCLDRGEKLGPKHELHHTLSATPDPHMSKTVQVWLALKLMPHRKCVLSLYGLDPNQPLHHDRNAQV